LDKQLIPHIELDAYRKITKITLSDAALEFLYQNCIVTPEATSIRNPSTPNWHQYFKISINSTHKVFSLSSNFKSNISDHSGTIAIGFPLNIVID